MSNIFKIFLRILLGLLILSIAAAGYLVIVWSFYYTKNYLTEQIMDIIKYIGFGIYIFCMLIFAYSLGKGLLE